MAEPPEPVDRLAELERTWRTPPGVRGFFTAVNNQPLGKRYMITSLIFFAIAGVFALLMRVQLAVPDNDWLHPDTFNALFTMHGSTMMYLFAVPFLEGLALYLLPMMIGSRDVAFPRLTAFSYWMYLVGGLIMYASFFFGHVPDAGWFAYTPLSGPAFADRGLDFWLLGLGLVEVAALTAGIEIVVTILKMRAPGMALHRMPLLVWAFLITGGMILFGITPLFMATMMLELDRAMGMHFFNPDAGGSTLLWQHIFWFFGHPDVYIIFIPATGVISSVIPVFARRPIVGYTIIVIALLITGFLSFGLWVHHMFATGLPQLSLVFFAGASFMIALASGAQVFAWIATLWASRPAYQTPLLYILGFLFIFVIGGITGVMVATIPFDLQVHDSYFIVAHFHYVLIGGAVFPIFAGIYYWFPKFSGRMPGEPLSKISFWLIFIGFNVAFFPMHHMGMFGMPRRVYTYPAELGLGTDNMIATVGSFALGLGYALALGGLIWSIYRGRKATANPWNAASLEWSIASPPPVYSFREPPVVTSRDPLWTASRRDADTDALTTVAAKMRDAPSKWRGSLVTDVLTARPQALQPLPGPTLVPIITALGFVATAIGVLFQAYFMALVGAFFAVGMLGYWLRPTHRPLPDEQEISESINLPVGGTGTRALAWWGVVSGLVVLIMALGTLIYAYFYIWLYSEQWPQDDLPRPRLVWASLAYGSLLLSGMTQVWASYGMRRRHARQIRIASVATFGLGVMFLILQVGALATADITPTENAYTSAFFATNWLLLIYAAAGVGVLGFLVPRLIWHDVDDPHGLRLHQEIAEVFWLFVVVAGLVTFATTYVSPYVL